MTFNAYMLTFCVFNGGNVTELDKKIAELRVKITQHNNEWCDAMGTCFEAEDWNKKIRELAYCLKIKGTIDDIDDVVGMSETIKQAASNVSPCLG